MANKRNDQFVVQYGKEKKDAFEGWFVKVDDIAQNRMMSFIIGYATHAETGHAFIQYTDSQTHTMRYFSYPLEEMEWQLEPFVFRLGENVLTREGLTLALHEDQFSLAGELQFGAFTPIATGFLKPNIMGWLSYLPNECSHSITSMHHTVKGTLQINNETVVIDGIGYIEKDWGTDFPKQYVWAQTNDVEDCALVFSYATVPMLGKHAKGFFLLAQVQGKEYRMSTIEWSRITHSAVTDDSFEAEMRRGSIRVTLKGQQAHPVALASPAGGQMMHTIKESLDGTLEVAIYHRERLIHAWTSERASMDVHFSS